MIPYGRQNITQDDIDAVVDVLRSDFLTQGPRVPEFEKVVSDYVGAKFGVAANSATSVLHVACLALGLGPGDWLWTSPVTFVASANCGLYCGANVDFIDIDPLTNNISIEVLERKLKKAEKTQQLPKVIVAVHLSGLPCDMRELHRLSLQYGFKIIEDASHAIGGSYDGKKIGSCQYSDITVFSFHPVKIVTTAEGGMGMTNSSVLAEKMRLYCSHGITRNPELMTIEPEGSWYYQQVTLGFNYRMTDLQAALGISQMTRIDHFVDQRHRLAIRYCSLLASLPVSIPAKMENARSGLHLYIIRLQLDKITISHREVFELLRDQGIGVNLHYIPVHLQPYYQEIGFNYGDFPAAEQYYKEALSLPMYPDLTEDQQDHIVDVLRSLL